LRRETPFLNLCWGSANDHRILTHVDLGGHHPEQRAFGRSCLEGRSSCVFIY
jgi:hypothetical protein